MRARAVLFDLDGTLLDTAPDLVAALNHLRAAEGLKATPVTELRRHVSHGAAGLLTAGMPPCAPAEFEQRRQKFLARYAERPFIESTLFDGVRDLLSWLEEASIPWGIVTNKSQDLTRRVLEASGLSDRSGCVVCGDTLERSKPDPAPVLHACDLLGVAPADVVFVGDDVRDLRAGRAAGTQVVAVDYGYGSWELDDEVVGDSPRIRQPGELIDWLRSSRG